jgi:hypothetical protein
MDSLELTENDALHYQRMESRLKQDLKLLKKQKRRFKYRRFRRPKSRPQEDN